MSAADHIADSDLPAELPEQFKGSKRMTAHFNYGHAGGAGLYRWHGPDGKAWPIQEQYDTRKPKPATGKKPAFEPPKTGVVIIDPRQPSGFYGPVCSTYSELREVWRRWRSGLPDGQASKAELDASGNNPFGTSGGRESGSGVPAGDDAQRDVEQKRGRRSRAAAARVRPNAKVTG